MTFEQTDGAVQAFDGRAEILARAGGQLPHQGHFPEQLQGVADMLDRPFGIGPEGPAAAVEGAAALGAPPAIDLLTALLCHNHDSMTTWL